MQYKVYYSRGQLMGTIEADSTEEAWAKAYDLVQSKPELHGCWINHRNTRLVMVEPFPSPAAAPTLNVQRWNQLLSEAAERPLTPEEEAEILSYEEQARALAPDEAPY